MYGCATFELGDSEVIHGIFILLVNSSRSKFYLIFPRAYIQYCNAQDFLPSNDFVDSL